MYGGPVNGLRVVLHEGIQMALSLPPSTHLLCLLPQICRQWPFWEAL